MIRYRAMLEVHLEVSTPNSVLIFAINEPPRSILQSLWKLLQTRRFAVALRSVLAQTFTNFLTLILDVNRPFTSRGSSSGALSFILTH